MPSRKFKNSQREKLANKIDASWLYQEKNSPVLPPTESLSTEEEYNESVTSIDEESHLNNTLLNEAYDENVRPVIDLIDKLREIGLENDISLPTIVVIGDQSSGKSSVLEAISGVQLPRGTGIVTRCPLELKMKNCSNWSAGIQYTSIYGERFEIEIDAPSKIENHIWKAQKAMTKNPIDISEDLISLNVTGPYVPDLSIVDLPGIARIAIPGQSKDICQKIKDIIHKYAKKENTVMLCVIPCNQDVATNESLNIAKEVDPEGKRTLGVLTKPDLMDRGTEKDILKLVKNKLYQLQKGFSVIKCRSQKEVDDGVSVNEYREIEKEFFENHDYFNHIYNDGIAGVENLANKLTNELVEHIKNNVPSMRLQLQYKLKEAESKYKLLGEEPPVTDKEKRIYMINIGNKISRKFEDLSKSNYDANDPIEYRLYASTYRSFQELNEVFLNTQPNECDEQFLNRIKNELSEQKGVELPPFLSFKAFKFFTKLQIDFVKIDISETVDTVSDAILSTISGIIEKETQIYPNLCSAYLNMIQELHEETVQNCTKSINMLLKQEETPFTMDQAYHDSAKLQSPDWVAAKRNSANGIFCEVHKVSASNSDLQCAVENFMKSIPPEVSKNWKLSIDRIKFEENNSTKLDANDSKNENNVKTCDPQQCLECIKDKQKKTNTKEYEMAVILKNYMKIVFTRLMDNIAMNVIHHFLTLFSEEMYLAFANFPNDPSNLKLISEENSYASERNRLRAELKRLRKGIAEISTLEKGKNHNNFRFREE